MTPTQTIDRLEALLEKATKQVPGEWTAGAVYTRGHPENAPPHWHILDMNGKVVMDTLNSAFTTLDHDYELGHFDTGTDGVMKAVAALKNAAPLLLALAREAELSRKVWPNELRDDMHTTPEIDALWKARATTDRLAKETKP